MAAEVAAVLLKQKLQNLLDDEIIVYPRLKRKINSSIVALQQLLSSSDDTDVIGSGALPVIYKAEDIVDTFLLKRAQRPRGYFIETHRSFQYLTPLWSQKDLGKGLKKFLNDLKVLPSHSSEHNNQESRVLSQDPRKGSLSSACRVVWLLGFDCSSFGQGIKNFCVLGDMLFKELIDKRYLIVLDDVWDAEAWHRLTIPLPDSKNGSRVILTSCNDEVMKLADPWNLPLHLCKLTNEERWELLWKQMKEHEGSLTEHKDEIMAKLCHGSPLGIVLLGGILSNTEPSEWPRKIDKFPSSCEDESAFWDILTLSYQELSPELKACFLYLGIFPKALEVWVQRLLWLWLSEGFLDGLPGKERKEWEPEDLAESYFKILVSRSLIEVTKWKLDGCPKMCRMPGDIREFFFPKSVDSGLFYVHENLSFRPNGRPKDHKIQRLMEYLEVKNSLDSSIDHRLRSFVSFNSARGMANRHIGMFLKKVIHKRGLGLLKVLDLEGVYKPVLPESMCNLLLLRFLGLRSTVLDSIPSAIGDLPCLETLDLKHTIVTAIPSTIWKAKNLRHFYMNEVHFDVFCHKPSKGSLTNLHTLRGLYVGDTNAVVSGLDQLVNLQKLGLTCHPYSLGAVAKWIEQLINLQSLKLRSIDEFGKPSKLKVISMAQHHNLCNLYLLGSLRISAGQLSTVLPSCLGKLTLSMLKLENDPMPLLGQLQDLRILRLFADSFVGPQITCVSGGFPKLRILKLWMLDKLLHWTVQDRAMPLLQELEIRRCGELKNSDGLRHLPNLNEIVLTNMPQSFVEEVRRSSRNDVILKVNYWKLSHYQVKFSCL
ncbi:hypothetical protein NL676_028420 [Syzygium grande]|nr:hypothetical protein NL676_028420 [Syzygium grande]